MKHRVLLRRALPLAVLAAVLYSAGWPASAFFFQKDEAVPSVAAMTKNGPAAEPISFSEEDFVVEGSGKLDSIVITTLPDAAVGCLTLGAQGIQVGDVIAMEAVDGLRFTPLAAPAGLEAQFQFTPVFSDGRSGDAVTVELYLLAEANGAPVAENLELTTYKNVAVTAQFSAVDPEGDLLTYHILNKPARGAVTMPEDGSSEFVYTPYENKTGKDSFTYVALDQAGNTSPEAKVTLCIEKPNTKVTYADLEGSAAHKAAIRLAEEGILVGESHGGRYFFQPEQTVSRAEFLALAMDAAGLEPMEDVTVTGFSDDEAIPTWAKGSVSSALKAGVIQGERAPTGAPVFSAGTDITCGEATVMLDRLLNMADVPLEAAGLSVQGHWAGQAAANLAASGVLTPDQSTSAALSEPLTRAAAAELLDGALDVLAAREARSWLPW